MSSSNLCLSVFVVTYNQEQYIKQCLESILMQKTDYNFEIVIGEDCSTDNTYKICKEYAAKYPRIIKLYHNNQNYGLTKNWIETLKKCNGEFIALCEGDDYWNDSNKLQRQYDFLKNNAGFSAVMHTVEIKDEAYTNRRNLFYYNDIYDIKEAWNVFVPTCSLFFRNQNIANFFPSNLKKYPVFGGDKLLLLGLISQGNIKYIDLKMAVYRINSNSLSINQKVKQTLNHNISLIRFVLTIHNYQNIFKEARKCLLINYGNLSIVYKNNAKSFKSIKLLILAIFQIRNYSDLKIFVNDFLIKFFFRNK